ALDEVVVEEERALERRRRTFEGVAEDPDQDPPGVEVRHNVPHTLGSGDRVVLHPSVGESGRGRIVVVRSERDDEDVGVVGASVRRYVTALGIDRRDTLAAELDSLVSNVVVPQPDVRGRLPAEQYVELREAEAE